MANRCFVDSLAQVSCQKPLSEEWFDSPYIYDVEYVRALDPDIKGLIASSEARRMSKILKRAVSTALTALNSSYISHPDAIITGTGMGCMENSEKFLTDLSIFGENCLKPTLFMQSTHNTISSLIAIIIKCHGYNSTYSHKGVSFESALLDAWIQIKSGSIGNALVGAHDEVTPLMNHVMKHTHPEYSFVSETSMSTVLTNTAGSNSICEVTEVKLFHRPELEELAHLLNERTDSILLLGVNGNILNDKPYHDLLKGLSYVPCALQYKNVFGENFSVSALAFYVGAKILEKQSVPVFLSLFGDKKVSGNFENVTILNHSDNKIWSMIRLKKIG